MTEYKIVECPTCHKLSIRYAEKVFLCPHCGHRHRLNEHYIVFKSGCYYDAYEKLMELQNRAGQNPHLEVFKNE